MCEDNVSGQKEVAEEAKWKCNVRELTGSGDVLWKYSEL